MNYTQDAYTADIWGSRQTVPARPEAPAMGDRSSRVTLPTTLGAKRSVSPLVPRGGTSRAAAPPIGGVSVGQPIYLTRPISPRPSSVFDRTRSISPIPLLEPDRTKDRFSTHDTRTERPVHHYSAAPLPHRLETSRSFHASGQLISSLKAALQTKTAFPEYRDTLQSLTLEANRRTALFLFFIFVVDWILLSWVEAALSHSPPSLRGLFSPRTVLATLTRTGCLLSFIRTTAVFTSFVYFYRKKFIFFDTLLNIKRFLGLQKSFCFLVLAQGVLLFLQSRLAVDLIFPLDFENLRPLKPLMVALSFLGLLRELVANNRFTSPEALLDTSTSAAKIQGSRAIQEGGGYGVGLFFSCLLLTYLSTPPELPRLTASEFVGFFFTSFYFSRFLLLIFLTYLVPKLYLFSLRYALWFPFEAYSLLKPGLVLFAKFMGSLQVPKETRDVLQAKLFFDLSDYITRHRKTWARDLEALARSEPVNEHAIVATFFQFIGREFEEANRNFEICFINSGAVGRHGWIDVLLNFGTDPGLGDFLRNFMGKMNMRAGTWIQAMALAADMIRTLDHSQGLLLKNIYFEELFIRTIRTFAVHMGALSEQLEKDTLFRRHFGFCRLLSEEASGLADVATSAYNGIRNSSTR